ncbi:ImmA/IrrE family metallo-endopeptidase [Celeribacter naphthalenivorans]|uniref:ImmA/IrrE family metallo-endopeptidase n=1 Tax=Celeribacter naphthalenivorans TaxID=1614694 RepID=UPI001CFBD5EA|nr:ImmA/IrrE family metallo-endopeptidase [Celeribacter naphthalenivorans]
MIIQQSETEILKDFMSRAGDSLEKLIERLGVRFVRDTDLGEKSGQIEFDGKQYTISVNALENRGRQRFTAAHEIAHYVLHRDLLRKKGVLNRHTDTLFDEPSLNEVEPFTKQHEIQANKYAARLLMPAPLVREMVSDGKNISEMAEAFRVSKPAMEIRLKNLGLNTE